MGRESREFYPLYPLYHGGCRFYPLFIPFYPLNDTRRTHRTISHQVDDLNTSDPLGGCNE